MRCVVRVLSNSRLGFIEMGTTVTVIKEQPLLLLGRRSQANADALVARSSVIEVGWMIVKCWLNRFKRHSHSLTLRFFHSREDAVDMTCSTVVGLPASQESLQNETKSRVEVFACEG